MIRARSLTLPAAVAALAIVACSSTQDAPAPSACSSVELLVAASDYASSVVCGAPCCEVGPATSAADLGKDPALAISKGRVFYIARDNEYLFELDAKTGRVTSRVSLHDGAAGSNPQDVAVARDGSLWVVLYTLPQIAIVRDGKIAERIDLSSRDADGNPQAASIRILDVNGAEKVFVTLQRLDLSEQALQTGMFSKQPSQMLRIDAQSRTVEDVIELAGRNPFGLMVEHDGGLFLAEPGNFNLGDEPSAGIERFDARTGTTRLLATEKELGGSAAEVAIADGCGVAIVAGPQRDVNPTAVVTFDPASGAVLKPATAALLGPTPGYDLQGLAWRGNLLYVGDRRAGEKGFRVHVFERDPGTCNLHPVDRVLDLPQRPVALRAAQ